MGVHDGHRGRLTERFLEEGLDGFSPHNILELILFYAVPRKDTNELAHVLLDTFGSLSGVLDAPVAELTAVPGVGEHTAALLHLIPHLTRAYLSDREQEICISSTEKAGQFLLPRFVGRNEECVFLVCVDGKCRVLSVTLLHKGNINSAEVSIRSIVAAALRHNAAGIILAHNHPGGVALPSQEDLRTTQRVREALEPVGIRLIDHFIVADGDFVSLADSGYNQK